MTATRWPQVVDALYDRLLATGGFRAAGGDDPESSAVLLLDGPELELTGDLGRRVLILGGTLDVDGEDHGGSGQSVATLSGEQQRDDAGLVVCQVVTQVGILELADGSTATEGTLRALRAEAFAVLDQVDALLMADRQLGMPNMRLMVARIGNRIVPRQDQTVTGGGVVSVEFTVSYTTRV